jgi:cyclopropane fatty-acyl-phospholipid synthase-like methyltransferase
MYTIWGANLRNQIMQLPLKLRKLINRLNFSTKDYWELRYQGGGNSGVGSYGAFCEAKAQMLNGLITKYGINEVIEFGCGDGNQLQFYNIEQYLGLDLSSSAISRCIEQYKGDHTKSFLHYDPSNFISNGKIFNAQTTLSVEVIFHLVEDQVYRDYMHNLFKSARDYVIVFSSNTENNKNSSAHLKHHKFTDLVERDFPEWELVEQLPLHVEGKHFNDWYVFRKNTLGLKQQQ